MQITPEQIRAARALLRLDQDEVARRAQVSVVTIRRLEAAENAAPVAPATLENVRRALEQAGAEFIVDGVRRHRRPPPDAEVLFRDLQAISRESAAALAGRELLGDADLYDEDGLPA